MREANTMKSIGAIGRRLALTSLVFTALFGCGGGSGAEATNQSSTSLDQARDDRHDPPPPPPAPATVRVGFFSTSLPLLAAQANGYFTDENLTLSLTQVKSSVQLFTAVANNTIDIAFSSPDNPANYRLNPVNAVGGALDVQIIFGTDRGLDLSVISDTPFTTVESLKGKRIGVDAVDSGFAYVLYKILANHGLQKGVDYSIVTVGGTPIRLAALRAHTIDATLLNSDSYVRAVNDGFNVLAPVSDVANPYFGGGASARNSWLTANRDVAVRFIRAYVRGHQWALDPANKTAAVALLAGLPNTPPALATQIYDALFDPTGLIPRARLDRRGLYNVLALRQASGGFEQPENLRFLDSPFSGLYDLSYYRRAVDDDYHHGEEGSDGPDWLGTDRHPE
jgi:ABC-type nitrate/sulfonate/bicarbonate transport system substrate-binding protein